MKTERYRDLSLLRLPGGHTLVTACDSCGSVGEKSHDALACPAEVTGALTARVALLEVLCAGAQVQLVYNTLSCEMHPTGEKVIAGIASELAKAGLDAAKLSGSTEENFETTMTAMGVVAVGLCEGRPRLGGVQAGDRAVLVATPKYGPQILRASEGELVTYEEIRALLALDEVREIAPCGSKGVLHEAQQIAAHNGLRFIADETDEQLLHASAGTASCAVVAVAPEGLARLEAALAPGRARVLGCFGAE